LGVEVFLPRDAGREKRRGSPVFLTRLPLSFGVSRSRRFVFLLAPVYGSVSSYPERHLIGQDEPSLAGVLLPTAFVIGVGVLGAQRIGTGKGSE
jgi:hypothetical protein